MMRSTWLFSVLLLGLLLVAERGNFVLKLCLVSLPENLTMVLFMSSVLHACAMDDILRGGDFVTHSITRPFALPLVRFVTTGYAVRAPFKFLSKSIGFPRARHHIGFIFSCRNLTDIGEISLCWKC